MANDDNDNEPLDPLSGRILGAGSNQLQRSIDSLNYTVQRLMTLAGAGGMGGGGGGRPPAVITSASPMDPRGGGNDGRGALVLRGQVVASRTESRFPAAVTWASQEGTAPDYEWGTPVRNAPGNELRGRQDLARRGVSLRKPGFPRPAPPPAPPQTPYYPYGTEGQGDVSGGGGGGGFNWRNAARNAQSISNRIGAWGTGLVKTGSVMDTYSQWAGIANAAPYSADGTNGGSVNAIRKFVFGSQGQNLTGWAQNVQDAQKAAFLISRNSGFTELAPGTRQTINPQFANYFGNVKDLSILNPTLNAAQTASMLGTLTSTRALYASQMYGYQSMLSPGGQVNRNAMGALTDSIMRRTFGGKAAIPAAELKASLGQNGSLHANISAYVQSVGGDSTMTQAIEDYITGRNTAAQKGLNGSQFDKLLAQYEKGGSQGEAAAKQLRKFGISNTILQSQKDLQGAKTGNVSDLMDSLGPAVKRANEALKDFYNWLDDIVNMPGVKQGLGTIAGWGSVFGPALGSMFGSLAGLRLGGGLMGGAGSLMGLRPVGGGGTLPGVGVVGGGGSLAKASAYGLGAVGVNAAGSTLAGHIHNKGWHDATQILTTTGTYAMTGAAIGSIVPGLGTGIGALVGGIAGAAKGAWDVSHQPSDPNAKPWKDNEKASALGLDPQMARAMGFDGRDGGGSSQKGTKGSSVASGDAIAGKSAAGAISAALSELGKPYVWGGTGPDGFDCSGLMQYAYRQIGVQLPRVSQDQMKVGKAVKQKDARPGDLMFPYPGHVVMYLGNGKIVEAPRTGQKIRVAPVSEYGEYVAIRRIVGSVGSYSGAEDQDTNSQKSQTNNAGGDSGSMVLSNEYGSTEELDAINSAISGVHHTLLNTPMNDSSSDSGSDDVKLADSGDYNWGAIRGKYTNVPKPPGWVKSAILKGMSAASVRGAKWARGLVTIAYRESTFNKGAVNKWDSNAKAGTPSKGMFQVIDPTFKAYHAKSLPNDPFNPASSAAAAANYIESRYGDISRVQQADPNKPPKGYAVGAWEIPEDHIAQVHKGEMIIEKPKADTIRQALMRDVVNVKDAATGQGVSNRASGSGISLTFHDGSIRFVVNGAMTSGEARNAASTFANALAENKRLQELGVGL